MTDLAEHVFEMKPIGKIWTGFTNPADCPHNGRLNPNDSILELDPAYIDGLLHLDSATHLNVLYWFDKADRAILQTKTPHVPDRVFGVFAVRSPNRPNPIALSTVRIHSVDDNKVIVSGLDCCDGTPLLDLKPFIPMTDNAVDARYNFKRPVRT